MTCRAHKRRGPDPADLAVFLAGLGVFVAFLHRGPAPGESAGWIATATGLSPFPALTRPLYGFAARALAALPAGGPLSFRLHLFSAFCGAACVFWLGRIVRALAPLESRGSDRRGERRFAGLVASAVLSVSFPFWHAATRAGPDPLALALMLAAMDRLLAFEAGGRRPAFWGFAALYGASLAEHPAALLAAPVILPVAVLVAARRASAFVPVFLLPERLEARPFWRTLLAGALFLPLGMAALPAHALWYRTQPAFAWRGLEGRFGAVRPMLLAYAEAARAAVPRIGGLLIALGMVLPALYILIVPRFVPRDVRTRTGTAPLMILFALVTGLVLLLDAIAPELALSLLAQRVIPSAAAAAAAGCLAGWWGIEEEPPGPFAPAFVRLARAVRRRMVPPFCLLLVLGIGIVNGRQLASANRQRVTEMARDALESLDGRTWLIHYSPLDDLLRVLAAESGASLDLLHLGLVGQPPYRLYLADRLGTPRYRSLAKLGAGPLLAEWLGRDDGAARAAAFGADDIWRLAGREPLPAGPLTLALSPGAKPPPDRVASRNEPVWRRYAGIATDAEAWRGAVLWNREVARHMSRAANNAGTWMEARDRPDLARRAYGAALRMDPGNLSAALNRMALSADSGIEPAPRLPDRLAEAGPEPDGEWVRQTYGEVFRPDRPVFAAYPWAARAGATPASASARPPAGEDPLFLRALQQGDLAAAEDILARMSDGLGGEAVAIRRALLDWLAGRPAAARDRVRTLAGAATDPAAWMLLGLLAFESGDSEGLTAVREAVADPRVEFAPSQVSALAELFLAAGRIEEARALARDALRVRPGDLAALEVLLQAATLEGRPDQALSAAARILERDPGHAPANHVIGSLHLARNEIEEAESALRVSLSRARSAPALNDLAFLLARSGRETESLELAREAIRLAPGFGAAWDTLGVALLRSGRLDEAEEALRRAAELQPASGDTLWHLALLEEARGRPDRARPMIESLRERFDELPVLLQEEIRGRIDPPRPARARR